LLRIFHVSEICQFLIFYFWKMKSRINKWDHQGSLLPTASKCYDNVFGQLLLRYPKHLVCAFDEP
jgi:hypothetical protein